LSPLFRWWELARVISVNRWGDLEDSSQLLHESA